MRVCVRGEWGSKYGEGRYCGYYRAIRILDADTGEIIRDYERVPEDLSIEALRRLGFIEPLTVSQANA